MGFEFKDMRGIAQLKNRGHTGHGHNLSSMS